MDVNYQRPKPPELIGLSYERMTPNQRKSYNDWQYERHRAQKLAGMQRYRNQNPEKRAVSQKKWRQANKEHLDQYMRHWHAKNPDFYQKQHLKRLANPKYIERQVAKEAVRQEREERRIFEKSLDAALKISLRLHREERRKLSDWKRATQANPILKIRTNISGRIYRYLKGKRKPSGTMQIIGCSMVQLREHLESQFKGSMNWDNYGRTWHVDHIVPCSYFDLSKPEEIQRCWHYSNLRPLWAKANIRQRDDRGDLTPYMF